MFDYMDEILSLQSAIFGSLNMSRSNSMKSSSQCRLAPLIPCIQDSSQLYDYCVKILFKLHASLPPDTLAGHRDRFLKQFQELRKFYLTVSTMKYFQNLIQIPLLPETPPNFLVQSDLGRHKTPVIVLPPEDTSHSNDTSVTGDLLELPHQNGSVSPYILAERDKLIEHLQQENAQLRMEIQRPMYEHQRTVDQLNEKIAGLRVDLATKDSELIQERQLKEDLLQQTEAVSKFQETEQKAKSWEEKFQKLKPVYIKLREEHIQLIRQKADTDKQLLSAQTMCEAAIRPKPQTDCRLQELMLEKSRAEESLQRSSNQAQAEFIILRQNQESARAENQATSISKAINNIETPVKQKHVRSAIIGTFHEKGAQTFWMCVLRLPLQDNRIVAWKFCHVLHKVLREGHSQVLSHSQRHRKAVEDLGKLWVHSQESYGKLIQCYTVLLVTKLDFHHRNPHFPGSLVVTKEELESIGENDINNYFQMCVEMFDYVDEILSLQSAIFGSLNVSRSNSTISSGQCRLAPFIPCIQDSSQLYDYCVKILFKLHASLPPDSLAGVRNRFLKQFQELREFYLTASTMLYFQNLIQIPLLPETPPNFLVQSDLGRHKTPVIVLSPEFTSHSNDISVTGDLLELPHQNGSVSPDVLAERDKLIDYLQQEIAHLRMEIRKYEHQQTVDQLNEKIAGLQVDLATKDSELIQERQLKEVLLQQTEAVSKFQETERNANSWEEKFQNLKPVYIKLREEHIQLIRQKADTDKQLLSAQTMCEAAIRSKTQTECRLQELMLEKSRAEESLQRSSNESQA